MRDGARLLGHLAELVLAAAAEAPHRPVEALLAEALRRATVPRRCTVLWHSRLSTAPDLHLLTGARCEGLAIPATILPAPLQAPGWLPTLSFPRDRHFERSVRWGAAPAASPWLCAALGLRTDPRIHTAIIGLDPDDSEAGRARLAELGEALRLHHSQLQHLLHILSALRGTAATRHREELRRGVEALLATTPPDPLAALPAATALLERLTLELLYPWGTDTIDSLAEPLVTWAVHGVLGSDVSPHDVAAPGPRAHLAALCDAIAGLHRRLPPSGRVRGRLAALEQALRAPLLQPAPPPLPLLPRWAGLRALASVLCRGGRTPPAAEARWHALTADSRRGLARLLCTTARRQPQGVPLAAVRAWLSLWLALELLQPPADHPDDPDRFTRTTLSSEQWRLRAALALVIQEGLRTLGLRHHSGLRTAPAALSAAVRLLVVHHARLVGGLPVTLDLEGHLAALAEDSPAVGGAGHLQHVLDLYLASHLLCTLELPGAPPESLGALLASRSRLRPGQPEQQALRAAISLAALFHDAGALLTHAPPATRARLLASAPELQAVAAQASRAGKVLAEQSRAALLAAGHLEPASEPGLLRWIAAQEQAGTPDHALLGAWYLLQVCGRAEGLSPEAVREAVRATLLHAALGERLDPDLEPAAVLLVLCDELLDWEPAAAHEADPDAADALQPAPSAPDPRQSRTAGLWLAGLTPTVDAAGRLRLHLGTAAPLAVTVVLQPPGVLAAPALRAWLRVAQNLGRVQPAQGGWAPEVTLRAVVPPRVRQATGSSHALLERTLQYRRELPSPLRTALAAWLVEQPLVLEAEGTVECFRIAARGQVLLPDGQRIAFPPLAAALLAVVRDLEREHGTHGQVLTAYLRDV